MQMMKVTMKMMKQDRYGEIFKSGKVTPADKASIAVAIDSRIKTFGVNSFDPSSIYSLANDSLIILMLRMDKTIRTTQ